jgi:hypothetical protein
MAGGSKRWRDFPDFQRFGRLQSLSDDRSRHAIFCPGRAPKIVGKKVLLTYI